ncbi:uncharacterized protein LOC131947204 [Physella acuta]|uniref:uncharacterized protein LOC131947204 n=1 Tax=Physella acuta TaxID=109671 RepID=UPI0027DC5BD6|nr:uncharacterized protein LOC131947204 [Physella acuta]
MNLAVLLLMNLACAALVWGVCDKGDCVPGTFFNTTSNMCWPCGPEEWSNYTIHRCESCKKCSRPEENEEVVANCTADRDTVTKCKPGYKKENGKCKREMSKGWSTTLSPKWTLNTTPETISTAKEQESGSDDLSTGKVVGIVVGCIVGAGVILGVVIAVICSRRRRNNRSRQPQDRPQESDNTAKTLL